MPGLVHRHNSVEYQLSTVNSSIDRGNFMEHIFLHTAGKGQYRGVLFMHIMFYNHISADKHVCVYTMLPSSVGT